MARVAAIITTTKGTSVMKVHERMKRTGFKLSAAVPAKASRRPRSSSRSSKQKQQRPKIASTAVTREAP